MDGDAEGDDLKLSPRLGPVCGVYMRYKKVKHPEWIEEDMAALFVQPAATKPATPDS